MMRPIRINGHRVPCACCRHRVAKTDFGGLHLCGACFRAFSIGLLSGGCMRD